MEYVFEVVHAIGPSAEVARMYLRKDGTIYREITGATVVVTSMDACVATAISTLVMAGMLHSELFAPRPRPTDPLEPSSS